MTQQQPERRKKAELPDCMVNIPGLKHSHSTKGYASKMFSTILQGVSENKIRG